MKVKVKKCKKSPAPGKTEQVLIEVVASSCPNLYSAAQKAIRGTSDVENIRDNVSSFRIPETAFVDMIDKIYNKVHNPLVKNGPTRYFPDLKISEYVKYFNL